MNSKAHRASSLDTPCASTLPPIFACFGNLVVELNTAQGSIFEGAVSGMEVEHAPGSFDFRSSEVSYFTLQKTAVLVLHSGARTRAYRLRNASACLRRGRLTVLAESIEPAILL